MADWTRPFTAYYRFVRVDRSTGYETARVTNILPGGKISRNSDSATYESASLDFTGSLDLGADLLRIYLDARFYDGSEESVCLGTFLMQTPERDVVGPVSEGGAKLYGRLKELDESEFLDPIVIPKGSNAVDEARGIAESCGLEVIADESFYTLSAEWSFGDEARARTDSDKRGETRLDAINELLDVAGFSAASTDPYGRVVMRRYVPPAEREPVWRYEEGINARFLTEATDERDTSDVANAVKVVYSTQDEVVVGTAVQTTGEFSVDAMGWMKTARYEYNDLPEGDGAAAMQRAADAKARELLETQLSVIRRVTLQHVYCPVTCDDAVETYYFSAGIEGKFAVRTQEIELGAGCLVEEEQRSFER